MAEKESLNSKVTKEALYGTLPVRKSERPYGMLDAFLILSGYAIATWCYTQGAFMAAYTDFPQMLISIFGANALIVALYMLPMMFAARYGIDMWIWMKSIFGTRGIKVVIVVIILINFPWFGVCADIFGSTMVNLFAYAGVALPEVFKPLFGVLCVVLGSIIAICGPVAIKWANRIIVPLLLLVGVCVFVIAFTAVPISEIAAYQPDPSVVDGKTVAYVCALEAGLASGFSWSASTAVTPRLCKSERDGYWATIGAYGLVTPIFNVVGAILAIAVFVKFGHMGTDIASMLAELSSPTMALLTLALVVLANICTHGTGAYMWSVVLKSAFPKIKYSILVVILGLYTCLIVLWGQILDYFGAMITLSTFIYVPVMALLFADYFFVRKRKISLRSAFEVSGHKAYRYTAGFNWVGFGCVIIGMLCCNMVFDAINYSANLPIFNYTTASLLGFVLTIILYVAVSKIPAINKYLLQDRAEITV